MQKIKFLQNSGQYFQICTVVWRSPISALQVGIVETVKLRHEFAPFLAYILNDLLHCDMGGGEVAKFLTSENNTVTTVIVPSSV